MLRAPEEGAPAAGAGAPGAGAGGIVLPAGAGPAAGAALPAAGADVTLTSGALKERLGEAGAAARKALLKEFGLDKQDDLKARLDELKALQDQKLSAEDRQKKALDEALARGVAGDVATATAQAAVDALDATLSPTEKAAIDARAPKTAAERLALIQLVTGLRTPAAAAAAAAGAAAPAGTPPANIAPPAGAPKAGTAATAFQKWDAMKAGSLTRSSFYASNAAAIEASRPAS